MSIKRIVAAVLIAMALVGANLGFKSAEESRLRSKVVKLVSTKGSCSGEQVKAPSGVNYILTAAHCSVLAENGVIDVINPKGEHLSRRIIAEDINSDLLLLEGLPNTEGLDIADSVEMQEDVRTYTHGAGMDTYKTAGELIQFKEISAMLYEITDDATQAKCLSMPKNQMVEIPVFFGIFTIKACVMKVKETVTTAKIVPGSSGGMVVDSNGKLIGVVSCGDSDFGYLVRLDDIISFMAAY